MVTHFHRVWCLPTLVEYSFERVGTWPWSRWLPSRLASQYHNTVLCCAREQIRYFRNSINQQALSIIPAVFSRKYLALEVDSPGTGRKTQSAAEAKESPPSLSRNHKWGRQSPQLPDDVKENKVQLLLQRNYNSSQRHQETSHIWHLSVGPSDSEWVNRKK